MVEITEICPPSRLLEECGFTRSLPLASETMQRHQGLGEEWLSEPKETWIHALTIILTFPSKGRGRDKLQINQAPYSKSIFAKVLSRECAFGGRHFAGHALIKLYRHPQSASECLKYGFGLMVRVIAPQIVDV